MHVCMGGLLKANVIALCVLGVPFPSTFNIFSYLPKKKTNVIAFLGKVRSKLYTKTFSFPRLYIMPLSFVYSWTYHFDHI